MGDNLRVGVAREQVAGGEPLPPILDADRDLVVLQEVPLEAARSDVSDVPEDEVDVVLLELEGDERSPGELTRKIVGQHPSARVMVLTSSGDRRDLEDAVRAGARGYVVKPTGPRDLVGALRLVAAGHMVIDGRFADARVPKPTRRRRTHLKPRDVVLTERNVQVLVSAVPGRDDEEIARALGVSVATVRRHLATICDNLGVADRDAAVAEASRRRFLLGRGRDFYAIWDVENPGPPVERFEETERARAWLRWQDMRADRHRSGIWHRLSRRVSLRTWFSARR